MNPYRHRVMFSTIDDYLLDQVLQPMCDYLYKEWGLTVPQTQLVFNTIGGILAFLTFDYLSFALALVITPLILTRMRGSSANEIALAMVNRIPLFQIARCIALVILVYMLATGVASLVSTMFVAVLYMWACYTPPHIPKKQWNLFPETRMA